MIAPAAQLLVQSLKTADNDATSAATSCHFCVTYQRGRSLASGRKTLIITGKRTRFLIS